MNRTVPLILSFLSLALPLAGTAAAQMERGIDELVEEYDRTATEVVELDRLVDDLSSESLDVRLRANLILEQSELITESQVIRQWMRDDLDAEQRTRLADTLRSRFDRSPRAGMGVRFSNVGTGVVIEEVIPEFPAAEQGLLRPGDEFVEVDGIPIFGDINLARQQVIQAIISHDPGELVAVTVVRREGSGGAIPEPGGAEVEAETMKLLVPLGKFDDLNPGRPRPHTDEVINAAWTLRMERLGASIETPAALRGTVLPEVWSSLRLPEVRGRRAEPLIATSSTSMTFANEPYAAGRRLQLENRKAQHRRIRMDEENEQFEQFRMLLQGEDAAALLEQVGGDPARQARVLRIIRDLVEFRESRDEQQELLTSRRHDARTREIIEAQLQKTTDQMERLRDELIDLVGDQPLLELRD